jgi:hypothetical protein
LCGFDKLMKIGAMAYLTALLSVALLASSASTAHQAELSRSAAQQGGSASEKSYTRAKKVLDAGIQALGGVEALRSINDFAITETIKQPRVPRPDPPFPTARASETMVIASARKKLFHEEKYPLGGYELWSRTYINGTEGVSINMRSKEATRLDKPSLDGFRHLYFKLPHFILLEALPRAASLRWLGEDELQGKKQQVISAVLDGQQTSLYFDARSGLLTKYEFLYTDPVHGDGREEHVFSAYRRLGNLMAPGRRITKRPGGLEVAAEYDDWQINTHPPDSWFVPPPDLTAIKPYIPPPSPIVKEIADDVHLVQGLCGGEFSVLFIAFTDHVVVVEALETRPFGNISEQVIATIKQTIPGKPIRYLIPTHHHWDHAGGARAYIAEGATIITTPGNKSFFERMAAAPFTMNPDALARRARPAVIETLQNKRRTLRDGQHHVELYDIGPLLSL